LVAVFHEQFRPDEEAELTLQILPVLEETLGLDHPQTMLSIWALGAACAMGVTVAWASSSGEPVSLLALLDDLVSRYMLPIGGLLIAIAAGWLVLPEDGLSGFRHLPKAGPALGAIWTVLIRYVTPVMVTVVLLWQAGAFEGMLNGEPPPAAPEDESSKPLSLPRE
jgi:SNF family Na+-dependent transporter